MHVINKNSRYLTTFDGEMNFAVLLFQLRYCNLTTLDRGCGLYQSVGVAKLIHS